MLLAFMARFLSGWGKRGCDLKCTRVEQGRGVLEEVFFRMYLFRGSDFLWGGLDKLWQDDQRTTPTTIINLIRNVDFE